MKKTLIIILTAALAIGVTLASCESTTGADEPQETTNEQEGLAATVDAVANFFELDPTDRISSDVDVAMFLKLGDISGESTDEAHEGQIDIFGIELGRTVRISRATNKRRAAGRATIFNVVFIKTVDKASPLLQKAAVSDEVFPTATLSIRKTGDDGQVEYMRIEMERVTITSYQMMPLDESPAEEVAMSTARYHFENGWPSR